MFLLPDVIKYLQTFFVVKRSLDVSRFILFVTRLFFFFFNNETVQTKQISTIASNLYEVSYEMAALLWRTKLRNAP